jgi:hypothetical protein
MLSKAIEMKSPLQKVLCVTLIGLCTSAGVSLLTRNMTAEMAHDDAVSKANGKPVAVIELFTSEGCSSCPPADSNLQRISKMQPAADGAVIPLSFHVDYWNYLGWEDPFSKGAFSERQRDYARGAEQQGVYTPQMIVNGKYAFNGSDAALTDKAIRLSLSRPVTHVVDVRVLKSKTDKSFTMNYSVKLADADAGQLAEADSDLQINIAVASESESVNVVRGENGGRELSHVWVVKYFDFRDVTSDKGVIEIDAAFVSPGRTRVVAYVQSKASREITGAAAVEL